ncbi:hypothetical protein Q1695_016297 [Nippostrongylus brasiliensis]|nr:hypothetical protein Q1695_016297 [Nippostrongylus brasiliensis]
MSIEEPAATAQSDDNTPIDTPPDTPNGGISHSRSGRFQTVKVKDGETSIPPSASGASVISSLFVEAERPSKDVGLPVRPPRRGHHALELNPKAIAIQSDNDYDLLERLRSLCRGLRALFSDPRRFGFQHICLLLMVLTYTLLGAGVFYLIESNYEQKMVRIRKAALDKTILAIAEEMTVTINDPRRTVDVNTMVTFLESAYVTLLKQESAYTGSTFYKAEDMEHNLKWTFGSSFFFSMNVFTTTGYGSIAPESIAGKSCVIVYGFLFVPLTLVVIRHLGNWTLLMFTSVYAKIVMSWRKIRNRNPVEDGEVFTLPVFTCMFIMLVYLMTTTTFIFFYDALSGPPDSGISYFLSFYFSFISISTIGLGDVMPNNVTFDPTITILFFFGMPLMKVVNSSTYQCVEKTTIGMLSFIEHRLASFLQGRSSVAPEMTKSRAVTLTDGNQAQMQEMTDPRNEVTIGSLLTFIKSDAHVYGRQFGRLNLTARKETV